MKFMMTSSLVSILVLAFLCVFQAAWPEAVRSAELQDETDVAAQWEGDRQQHVIVDKGVRIDFSVEPLYGKDDQEVPVLEGEFAAIHFRLSDATTGAPISALEPAVWVDQLKETRQDISCKNRIRRYLQGTLAFQPDIDMNKYFILVMNNDHTISVVDPILGITGYTQLYAMIILEEPGEDWQLDQQQNRLYVTMPKAGQVAVVDMEKFKVIENLNAGPNPVRVSIQPDGRYLWVGNDGMNQQESGVTIIDPLDGRTVAFIPTGIGHHEIAFSDDSLHAYVTNSAAGTLSVIDVQKLSRTKDIAVGKNPVALAFSTLSQSVYAISEAEGSISVIDGRRQELSHKIATEPGLISLRFAPGDRWGFVANLLQNRVDIFDASSNTLVHTLSIGSQPHQFAFTDDYAYVRSLGTASVSLIKLSEISSKGSLPVQEIPFGTRAPGLKPARSGSVGARPSLAASIHPTGEYGAVLAANQAETVIFYYMEGMIAPMGTFPTYGRIPRAVSVIDRSVKESDKGVYTAKFRVPESGRYNVAFLLDAPWVDQCFEFTAEASPLMAANKKERPLELNLLNGKPTLPVGQEVTLEFSLSHNKQPLSGVEDLNILLTTPPFNRQTRLSTKPGADGIYIASVTANQPGVYYLFFSSESLAKEAADLPYFVLRTREK